jgi:hypothetical protein
MFRSKRADTLVRSVEESYGIALNARSDMKLRTLLAQRGFDSLSQLIKAARGRLPFHPKPRSVFLSFHREDLQQVTGFRLMMQNDRLTLSISDEPARYPVRSIRSAYIRQVLRDRIANVDVLICLIGIGTAWRDWVEWEIETAAQLHCGLCGIRLKGSRGRVPPILRELGAMIAPWDVTSMTAAIECAAAIRS